MAYELDSLEAVSMFLDANGTLFEHGGVVVTRLRVRDAREASQRLDDARRNGLRVGNVGRVKILGTAGFILECVDMIIGALLQDLDALSVDRFKVQSLRSNADFIRAQVSSDAFFDFIADDVQKMVSVAREMVGPSHRNYGKLRRSLEDLRASITTTRDKEVVFPSSALVVGVSLGPGQPAATAPAPIVVDAPAPKEDEGLLVDAPDAPALNKEEAPVPKEDEALLVDAASPARKEKESPAPKEDEALLVDAATPARKEEEATPKEQEALLDDAATRARKEEFLATPTVELDGAKEGLVAAHTDAGPAPDAAGHDAASATPASTPTAPEEEEEAS